ALNGVGAPDDYGNVGSQKGDTIELWRNAQPASDFRMTADPAEGRLFAQRYDVVSGSGIVNSTSLARMRRRRDGSSFGRTPDYFGEFAVRVGTPVGRGVIAAAADLDRWLLSPAPSAASTQYNKAGLVGPSLPATVSAPSGTATRTPTG